jgi:hypothetical protein
MIRDARHAVKHGRPGSGENERLAPEKLANHPVDVTFDYSVIYSEGIDWRMPQWLGSAGLLGAMVDLTWGGPMRVTWPAALEQRRAGTDDETGRTQHRQQIQPAGRWRRRGL